jgi:hypothetical protein
LALQTPPIRQADFQKAVNTRPSIRLAFEKKCAECCDQFLDKLHAAGATMRTLPAELWAWERRFAEHFAQPKAVGATVNVQVNTVLNVPDEVMRRAAALVKRTPDLGRLDRAPKGETKPLAQVAVNDDGTLTRGDGPPAQRDGSLAGSPQSSAACDDAPRGDAAE